MVRLNDSQAAILLELEKSLDVVVPKGRPVSAAKSRLVAKDKLELVDSATGLVAAGRAFTLVIAAEPDPPDPDVVDVELPHCVIKIVRPAIPKIESAYLSEFELNISLSSLFGLHSRAIEMPKIELNLFNQNIRLKM